MYGRPVFGSKLETEDWEAVQKIDSSKDRLKALSSVIDKILGNDGQVHSVILTELIKITANEFFSVRCYFFTLSLICSRESVQYYFNIFFVFNIFHNS